MLDIPERAIFDKLGNGLGYDSIVDRLGEVVRRSSESNGGLEPEAKKDGLEFRALPGIITGIGG